MRGYSLTADAVRRMPIHIFWMLSRNLSRLMAEADMRSLAVSAAAQSPEGYGALMDKLETELGEIQKVVAVPVYERDEEGFEALKQLAQM